MVLYGQNIIRRDDNDEKMVGIHGLFVPRGGCDDHAVIRG
jgi:hypothetical protein